MITPRELRQKQASAASLGKKGDMKTRTTYRLLVQSEEKSKNLLELAVYGLVALSVILTIWQFAEQPLQSTDGTVQRDAGQVQIAS